MAVFSWLPFARNSNWTPTRARPAARRPSPLRKPEQKRNGELRIPIPAAELLGEIQAQKIPGIFILILTGRRLEPIPNIQARAQASGYGDVAEFERIGCVSGDVAWAQADDRRQCECK